MYLGQVLKYTFSQNMFTILSVILIPVLLQVIQIKIGILFSCRTSRVVAIRFCYCYYFGCRSFVSFSTYFIPQTFEYVVIVLHFINNRNFLISHFLHSFIDIKSFLPEISERIMNALFKINVTFDHRTRPAVENKL